jgi:hypothetical protein
MMHRFGFRLLDSARDFITAAVGSSKGYFGDWKFATVHLSTALELLLKARLAIEDPKLLAKGSTISEADLESGNFNSVSIKDSLRCLAALGFEFTGEQRDALQAVNHLRNRFVHYAVPEDRDRFIAVLASGLNLFFELEFRHFRHLDPYDWKAHSDLINDGDFESFVKQRLNAVQTELSVCKRPRTHYFDECPDCLQDVTVFLEESIHCLYCRRTVAIDQYAKSNSAEGIVECCPECSRKSIVTRQRRGASEPTRECFCCGYFVGPELTWSDGKESIPRLHTDRNPY